ncbi:Cytokinin 7-beta-glucosyltransferase [Bertholletia excelsa]
MESQIKRRRLVLFPLPLQGHINPMIQLANILHSRGFAITIIHTRFNSPKASKYPHFAFRDIPDGLLESDTSTATADVIALVTRLNLTCAAPFRDCLAGLLAEAAEEEEEEEEEVVACLITDADWHFSQAVADGLKIPRVVLRPSSISSFLAFPLVPLMRDDAFFPIQDIQGEELPPLKHEDIPTISTGEPENLYKLIENMVKQTKASAGLIWNTFEELEPAALVRIRHDFPVPSFPIGPFHKYFPASSSSLLSQDRTSLSWLDKQAPNSVIYVSFGSIAAMDEADFLEMAWGLANSLWPFLWVVRPGLVRGAGWLELLPGGLKETIGGRGHIVQWAPQQEVLAHRATGGFWTHCGWNSTLESICEGVPMICSPCFGDQKVNARYVSDVWGIGLRLENGMERREVEKVIRRVMAEKEGEEMRERIGELKRKMELCLKKGGSSYNCLESLVDYISSVQL